MKYERQHETRQDKLSKCEFPTLNLITNRTPSEKTPETNNKEVIESR